MDPRLKELIGQAADKADVPMNEWIAGILARRLGRPDLAAIPRLPLGRRRKESVLVLP